MEIKIDINGSDTELATFLHSFTINHSRKTEAAVKTANTKKKGRPKKTAKAGTDVLSRKTDHASSKRS